MFTPSHIILDEYLKPTPVMIVDEFLLSDENVEVVIVTDGKRKLAVKFYELLDMDHFEYKECDVCKDMTLYVSLFFAAIVVYILYRVY